MAVTSAEIIAHLGRLERVKQLRVAIKALVEEGRPIAFTPTEWAEMHAGLILAEHAIPYLLRDCGEAVMMRALLGPAVEAA